MEQDKMERPEEAGRSKIPPPAEMQQQETQQRYSNRRREFRRSVKHGGSQAAFVFGEPVADGFRIGGKCRSLTDPQEETRPKQTADAPADGPSEGSHPPNHGADEAPPPYPKTIQQQPGRQFGQRGGPIEKPCVITAPPPPHFNT